MCCILADCIEKACFLPAFFACLYVSDIIHCVYCSRAKANWTVVKEEYRRQGERMKSENEERRRNTQSAQNEQPTQNEQPAPNV